MCWGSSRHWRLSSVTYPVWIRRDVSRKTVSSRAARESVSTIIQRRPLTHMMMCFCDDESPLSPTLSQCPYKMYSKTVQYCIIYNIHMYRKVTVVFNNHYCKKSVYCTAQYTKLIKKINKYWIPVKVHNGSEVSFLLQKISVQEYINSKIRLCEIAGPHKQNVPTMMTTRWSKLL